MTDPLSVSVRWLVEKAELGLRIRAGGAGVRREIRWAHCIELPEPAPWLQGGELVLTTGLRLPRSAGGQRAYVRSLDRAGVTALALGTGLTHDRVPDVLLEAAEELGLPLLEVPFATPFEAVTTAVMERLAARRYAEAARASVVQARMTRAAVRDGVGAVVRELAAVTGGRALLLAADHAVVAAHPAGAEAERLRDHLVAIGALGAASFTEADREGETTTVDAVRVGSRLHGHLAVRTPGSLSQVARILFGHAVSLVALAHELPARDAKRRRLVDEAVVGLLTGAVPATEAAADYLAGGGLAKELRVLVSRPSRPPAAAERVVRALAARDVPTLVRVAGAEVVVLLAGDADAAFAEAVARDLGPGGYAGLSRPHPPAEAPAALAEARTALGVAVARRRLVVEFAALAGAALLAMPDAGAELRRVAAARLEPLAAYDRAHGTELVGSLRAFLEHHGQWEAAAAALGVHRHTLRSRITRAAGVLGCDLDSAHVRAELLLCLTAWATEQ